MLDKNQKLSLEVLAYLYLRMNLWDKAKRTYKALIAQAKGKGINPKVYIALASIALEENNGKEALKCLTNATNNMTVSSKNAVIFLMKAKALWLEDRKDEAKNAVYEYLYLVEKS